MHDDLIDAFDLARAHGHTSPYQCGCISFERPKLVEQRRANQLTQTEFGRRVGYSQGRVSHFETGADSMSLGQAVVWARALGLCCWTALVDELRLADDCLLKVHDLVHRSLEARIWWARARVAEHRGDAKRCNLYLELAVLFERIEGRG